jgi:hypothetical protein
MNREVLKSAKYRKEELEWKCQSKNGAALWVILRRKISAMRACQLSGNCQPQAAASFCPAAPFVSAVEAFENVRECLL